MRKLQMHELNRVTVKEFKALKKHPVCVVLDNVRSTLNVGSVFRTADAFKIQRVYLCGLTPTPEQREMRKTALGGTESVAWSHYEHTHDALSHLTDTGYEIIGVEQTTSSESLEVFPFTGKPVAFIFGNEVKGVSPEALTYCDRVVEIPQFGTKHSLNISVSTGIILWKAIEPFLR